MEESALRTTDLSAPPLAPEERIKRPRKRRFGERGQSLVEMAFVLPIFLIIVMATIDFGMAFREYITITNAAREGARLGITGATSAQMKTRTIERANSLSNGPLTTADVTTSCNPTTCATGSEVKVTVVYQYEFITPLAGFLNLASGSNTITLESSTSMRRE